MGIHIVSPSQTSRAIGSVLGRPGKGDLIVEVFYVRAFCGIWYELRRHLDESQRLGGFAAPMLTERLTKYGVQPGDAILVARVPGLDDEFSLRVVSPLSDENRHLIGQVFQRKEVVIPNLGLTIDPVHLAEMAAAATTVTTEWSSGYQPMIFTVREGEDENQEEHEPFSVPQSYSAQMRVSE